MGNRQQNPNYQPDDNEDDSYPPRNPSYPPAQSSYPPQQNNISLDDPRFGSGAPAPGSTPAPHDPRNYQAPQQPPQYPPQQQQGGYPPPNQPQGGYPPPQAGASQSGSIDLNDPRFGGSSAPQQPPQYPPQQQQGGYPPPNQPQGGYPPPQAGASQGGSIDLNAPRFGGSGAPQPTPSQTSQPSPQANYGHAPQGTLGGSINIDDNQFGGNNTPSLGSSRSNSNQQRRSAQTQPPPSERSGSGNQQQRQQQSANQRHPLDIGLTERQVESLAIGITVILFGVAIIQGGVFLGFYFPLAAAVILMVSAIYQNAMGWRVSFFTSLIGLTFTSYVITRIIGDEDTAFFTRIGYFFGSLIILIGLIRLMRIFR